MEHHQVYGLATPEDFVLPPHHPLWTEETYSAFQFTPDASEKYDTKVSHSLPAALCSGLPLCRPLPTRRTLVQYQNQILHLVKCLNLRQSQAAPSPELTLCNYVSPHVIFHVSKKFLMRSARDIREHGGGRSAVQSRVRQVRSRRMQAVQRHYLQGQPQARQDGPGTRPYVAAAIGTRYSDARGV